MVTELFPFKFEWAGLTDEEKDPIETSSPDTDLDDTDEDEDDDAPDAGDAGTDDAEPLE
jgi:hypothetical protein